MASKPLGLQLEAPQPHLDPVDVVPETPYAQAAGAEAGTEVKELIGTSSHKLHHSTEGRPRRQEALEGSSEALEVVELAREGARLHSAPFFGRRDMRNWEVGDGRGGDDEPLWNSSFVTGRASGPGPGPGPRGRSRRGRDEEWDQQQHGSDRLPCGFQGAGGAATQQLQESRLYWQEADLCQDRIPMRAAGPAFMREAPPSWAAEFVMAKETLPTWAARPPAFAHEAPIPRGGELLPRRPQCSGSQGVGARGGGLRELEHDQRQAIKIERRERPQWEEERWGPRDLQRHRADLDVNNGSSRIMDTYADVRRGGAMASPPARWERTESACLDGRRMADHGIQGGGGGRDLRERLSFGRHETRYQDPDYHAQYEAAPMPMLRKGSESGPSGRDRQRMTHVPPSLSGRRPAEAEPDARSLSAHLRASSAGFDLRAILEARRAARRSQPSGYGSPSQMSGDDDPPRFRAGLGSPPRCDAVGPLGDASLAGCLGGADRSGGGRSLRHSSGPSLRPVVNLQQSCGCSPPAVRAARHHDALMMQVQATHDHLVVGCPPQLRQDEEKGATGALADAFPTRSPPSTVLSDPQTRGALAAFSPPSSSDISASPFTAPSSTARQRHREPASLTPPQPPDCRLAIADGVATAAGSPVAAAFWEAGPAMPWEGNGGAGWALPASTPSHHAGKSPLGPPSGTEVVDACAGAADPEISQAEGGRRCKGNGASGVRAVEEHRPSPSSGKMRDHRSSIHRPGSSRSDNALQSEHKGSQLLAEETKSSLGLDRNETKHRKQLCSDAVKRLLRPLGKDLSKDQYTQVNRDATRALFRILDGGKISVADLERWIRDDSDGGGGDSSPLDRIMHGVFGKELECLGLGHLFLHPPLP